MGRNQEGERSPVPKGRRRDDKEDPEDGDVGSKKTKDTAGKSGRGELLVKLIDQGTAFVTFTPDQI